MARTASSSASTSLFDDCLDASPSFSPCTMRPRLHVRLPRHRHPTTTWTTTSPRMATSTKVATPTTLGYLDIGTRDITSHEHSSACSTVQASVTQLCSRRFRSDCEGCHPIGFYAFDFSPV
jgi:hypothetical protein